ncbi:phosphoribosylglycinamide formyltransferase [Aneurinibacillus tyrosinisolvens]|uniref:phosphoribosylglycinamide formyltransferase n=1 Tax=Aneurinibacillus tyrosinisolvens TaxID=1443435 RepID=UPI00063EE3B8|nr:phosphoribosylglycinamide formyltransferase [Aneurinibacillus tyrosinisolvens]
MKIAVFASGSGSNFGAIMQAIAEGSLTGAEVVLLVCDKPEAYVLKRAAEYSVPTFAFRANEYSSKAAVEAEIVHRLEEAGAEFIVLAGYMRLIGDTLLASYGGRMINLHPSLLPSFAGKDAVGQALRYGVKVTGITVHFVDEGMDTGPIIAQRMIPVYQDDTKETLVARVQEEEHRLLPQVVQLIVNGQVRLDGRKVTVEWRNPEHSRGVEKA